MSVGLFSLAVKEINSSEKEGSLFLTGGHSIHDVAEVGIAKAQPGIAYAVSSDVVGDLIVVYFQTKDLIAFKADYKPEEESDEPEENRD